jgi:hypothetical protein
MPRIAFITRDSSRSVREISRTTITVTSDQPNEYLLMRANLQPKEFDRLSLALRDVYATYGPNAGGPLTIEEEEISVSLPEIPSGSTPLLLRITFDAAASFDRTATGTWQFSPRFSAEIVEATNSARAQ